MAAVSSPRPFAISAFEEARIAAVCVSAELEQLVAAHQLGLAVVAQAPRSS